ncbi:Mucin-associated surface protein (MASP) [Trypanosoma cruzi]|uniref:Mucin-associated surface protein (MASP) n=1 Tax=Trypanosoma cruzi TaxID=5693 RepID=A0A2V2V7G3_TRYCR|nr:Mucin-associated surface protein (MASP), subgroup S008 [Trypanosoma cruzi]PWU91028.1 Mucin-associated surface protein (MASP) [Trypanosoma cruzi]
MVMMSGHLLLVGAICVLWCGLSGVAADDAGDVGSLEENGTGKDENELKGISSPGLSVPKGKEKPAAAALGGGGAPDSQGGKDTSMSEEGENILQEHGVNLYVDLPKTNEDENENKGLTDAGLDTRNQAAPPTPLPGTSGESPEPPLLPAVKGPPASPGVSSQEPPTQASTKLTVPVQPAELNTAGSVTPVQSQGGLETMQPTQEPPKVSSIPDTGTQKDSLTEDRAEKTLSPAGTNDTTDDHSEEEIVEESPGDAAESGVVLTEGNESETPGSGSKETKTSHTKFEESNAVTPGNGESSPTAPPAGESDAATTTTPNNHDARSLNNNGDNTFTEELDQKAATTKPKSAPESTDTAAANSEASTTAITISTNTKNKTTTGDSDSSTAVSHTTSPFLLLLFVACAAAAAVVAA